MKRKIVLTGLASAELTQLAEYLAESSLRAAAALYDAAQVSFERLAESPDRGALCDFADPQLRHVRVWQIRGFPNHLVYYRATESELEILRILHGARDSAAVFDG